MDNKMQLFENAEFGRLEILMIGEKPYFPATECAKILGYSNPHKAIADHCPHLTKREVGVTTGVKGDGTPIHQTVAQNFISEGDLYRLIVRSKLPAAERFERFVFDEVLPTIRKQGAYITESALKNILQNSALLPAPRPQLSECNKAARLITGVLKAATVPPEKMIEIIRYIYEPLGIPISLDGMTGQRSYTVSEIARMNGVMSLSGRTHFLAVTALLSKLDIEDEHKHFLPYQRGSNVGMVVQYDQFAADAVKDWLEQNNWPCEIVCGKKTYKVKYKNRESVLEDGE